MDNFCNICFENREEFVFCVLTKKHKWCLECYNCMLLVNKEKCPFCRTPMAASSGYLDWSDPNSFSIWYEDDDMPDEPLILIRQNIST